MIPGVSDSLLQGERVLPLAERLADHAEAVVGDPDAPTRLTIFHGYIGVLAVAFLLTLVATPIMRRLAINNGIVDRPNDPRKIHREPVAYLGGVAVFIGIMGGIGFWLVSAIFPNSPLINLHETQYINPRTGMPFGVPISIVLGMTVIMLLGLIDDVVGIEPRLKIAGQLFAAAALAIDDVGVKVAQGVLSPTLGALLHNHDLTYQIPLPMELPGFGGQLNIDLIYWAGTAIIAIGVLGACNASNLIDGLDGLLTGVTAICVAGVLGIALSLALVDDGPRDGQRIVLCLAVLGACLGFLPHNFNPASIFLGDCGSMLLGFSSIVIILTLGDTGQTALVVAGMTMYAIPLIDTVLAIVRRKLAGKKMSDADSDHLHHMLKRSLGVKGAVFALYGIGGAFAIVGYWMSMSRARITYAVAVLIVSYITVTAIKLARRRHHDEQRAAAAAEAARVRAAEPEPAEVT